MPYKGLAMRPMMAFHQHWWKLLDKGTISSVFSEKTCQFIILHPAKLAFMNEGSTKTLADKPYLTEFMTQRLPPQ